MFRNKVNIFGLIALTGSTTIDHTLLTVLSVRVRVTFGICVMIDDDDDNDGLDGDDDEIETLSDGDGSNNNNKVITHIGINMIFEFCNIKKTKTNKRM